MCGIQLCMHTCPVIARRKMCLNSFRFAVYAIKINFSIFFKHKTYVFFKNIKYRYFSLNLWILWIMQHFTLDRLINKENVCIYYWMKLLLNLQILHFTPMYLDIVARTIILTICSTMYLLSVALDIKVWFILILSRVGRN